MIIFWIVAFVWVCSAIAIPSEIETLKIKEPRPRNIRKKIILLTILQIILIIGIILAVFMFLFLGHKYGFPEIRGCWLSDDPYACWG